MSESLALLKLRSGGGPWIIERDSRSRKSPLKFEDEFYQDSLYKAPSSRKGSLYWPSNPLHKKTEGEPLASPASYSRDAQSTSDDMHKGAGFRENVTPNFGTYIFALGCLLLPIGFLIALISFVTNNSHSMFLASLVIAVASCSVAFSLMLPLNHIERHA